MSRTGSSERPLGPGMRLLTGGLGVIAVVGGLVVAVLELRAARIGAPLALTLLAMLICVLAVLGGIQMIQGALRGRIAVRRTGDPGRD